VLSKTQVAVAHATPYVGLYKGKKVAEKYTPTVTSGFSVSPSMIPWPFPDGKKYGLPVQEMDWGKFCKKSGELGGQMMFFWAPGSVGKLIGKFAGKITGSFPSYFCGGGAAEQKAFADVLETLKNDMADLPKKACEGLAKCATTPCYKDDGTLDTAKNDDAKKYANPDDPDDFNSSKCKDDKKKQLDEELKKNVKDEGQNGLDPGKGWTAKTPKDVWSGAKHGDVWFSVYGVTIGDEDWPRQYDKGVAIAAKTGLPPPPLDWGNYRLAQSEFYCHKQKGKKKEQEWGKLKEECMWNMWWRARLRRVHLDAPDIASWLTGKGLGAIQSKIGDVFKGKLNTGGTLGSIFGQEIYKKSTDWLKDKAVAQVGGIDGWVDSKLDGITWEIIH
jgi:hypothetical protein